MVPCVAWYLLSVISFHLVSSASGLQLTLCVSSSQNSPSLVTLPMFTSWPLANQCFIKLIGVTTLYSVQGHHPTALCIRALSPSRIQSSWLVIFFYIYFTLIVLDTELNAVKLRKDDGPGDIKASLYNDIMA